jgi:hypothetical protein
VRPYSFAAINIKSAVTLSEAQALKLYEPEAKALHGDCSNVNFYVYI